MPYTAETYKEHLLKEHKQSAFSSYLKEIVYGANDGIVTTFAVVAGFTGASAGSNVPTYTFLTVLLFGLANLLADGTSMALGNFLSIRADKDVYKQEKNKELHEIQHAPEMEKAETMFLLQSKGFSEQQSLQLTELFMTNEEFWTEFMMQYELQLANPEGEKPVLNALATFLAFVTFGFMPILPYVFIHAVQPAFYVACFFSLGALILLGMLKGIVSKTPMPKAIAEIVLVGGTSAVIAYFVGTLFRG